MKVHSALGPGFLESVYENALVLELEESGIAFERQKPLAVSYRGKVVGDFLCDLLIEDQLIIELKANQALITAHEVQLVNYLTATGLDTGLLLNFGSPRLEYKKKFRNPQSVDLHSVNSVNSVQKVQANAFTMLELLVAMAVFSLLIVLLMGMVDGATKLWRENENRVDAYREARAALGMMARDLNNAIAANNTNYILINTPAFAKLQEADVQKNTNTAGAIFFLSAQPAAAQDLSGNKSDVCEVGYFLAYGNTSIAPAGSTNNKSMGLYRYFRSSNNTFSNLLSGSASLFSNVTITGAHTDLLARNVKSFRITPYQIDASNNRIAYNPATNAAMPDLVEISVTALNQDTARKMDSASDWTNSSGPLTNIIQEVEQTFTTRLRLKDKL